MTSHMVRWTRVTAGLAVTLIFLWLALRHVRFGALVGVMQRTQWIWMTASLVALTCDYAARTYRWWWMLRINSPSLSLRSCVGPLIAGFAVNNVAPLRAGDALRIVGFGAQLGTPVVRILGSLLLERVLDFTILTVLFLIGLAGLDGKAIPRSFLRIIAIATAGGALCWVVLLFIGKLIEPLILRLCRHRLLSTQRWTLRAEQHVRQLFLMLRIVDAPERVLKLIAMSAAVWGCEGLVFATVAYGVHYDGRPFGPWFALAIGSLSTLIPSSPGYVGTFDFFTLSGLTAYGASASVGAAMTLVVHGVLWLPLTLSGLIYLMVGRLRGQHSRHITKLTAEQERM